MTLGECHGCVPSQCHGAVSPHSVGSCWQWELRQYAAAHQAGSHVLCPVDTQQACRCLGCTFSDLHQLQAVNKASKGGSRRSSVQAPASQPAPGRSLRSGRSTASLDPSMVSLSCQSKLMVVSSS